MGRGIDRHAQRQSVRPEGRHRPLRRGGRRGGGRQVFRGADLRYELDLELEQANGGIDDESYTALHDDYTARLAATLRSLRDDQNQPFHDDDLRPEDLVMVLRPPTNRPEKDAPRIRTYEVRR